ncbi:PilW family protein [Desulfurobacterium atlanticum]|uniref:Prepilin peptidase dependent protein B n=1 Tax=Desulfurobacterium atlanticum TaxID=240169 RepID=A0A238XL80_9BACT|nr:prepilin-type N-terminal cleavage/methylation domain-containing protein [Desulfurobacterium atlanticum]SNR59328.1 prepilin peptidase dependent protein B [Desulfurobacterium atlanticum]
MKWRSGFTLTELIVGMSIALILMTAAFIFFSVGYRQMDKTMKKSRGSISIFNALEIIDSDLKKAGYGDVEASDKPVEWNGSSLIVRYVNYENVICENKTWSIGDSCSYEIKYFLQNNNLYRYVDEGADGTGTEQPMFDESIVTVNSFNVDIDNTTKTVSYVINGTVKDKPFSIGDKVICRNW